MSLKVLLESRGPTYYLPFFPVVGKDYEMFAPKLEHHNPIYMVRHIQRNSLFPDFGLNQSLEIFAKSCWDILIERIIILQGIYRDYRKRKEKAITDVLSDHKIHFKLNLLKYI